MGLFNKKVPNKNEYSINVYSLKIFIAFIAVFAVFTLVLSTFIINKAAGTMKENFSSLVSSNTYQQVLNVDNYFEKIKNSCSLLFADEIYYQYDATDENIDEFDKIQIERQILNRIEELGVLESYSDFNIIYSNNHKIGWTSDGTYKISNGSGLYKVFSELIADAPNNTMWYTSDLIDYSKIYYIKRLNENAILTMSLYSREIESVFQLPLEMKNMTIRLLDEKNIVIYSTDKEERGKSLPTEINDIVSDNLNCLVVDEDYFVTTNRCNSNYWKIVCSMPSSDVLKDINNLKLFIALLGIALFAFVIIFGFIIMKKATVPFTNMMSDLQKKANHDQLSGLFNKISFSKMVSAIMDTNAESAFDVFIMMDMDNFKKINDNLGHNVGDEVIIRFASLIKNSFNNDYLTGRVGGDEFAVYTQISNLNFDEVKITVKKQIEEFRIKFSQEFKKEYEFCKLSLSIGVSIAEAGKKEFEDIYKLSDSALYKSKKNGKNQYTFSTEMGE